jgi:imidazolonepropionase-like amidohydrolase
VSALLGLSLLALGFPDEAVVVRGGRLLTLAGREVAGGALVIEGGKIRRVGAAAEVPEGARVIDATGKVVIPGLVDAASTLGIAGQANEDASEVTPHVRILDAVDPRSRDLRRAQQAGITTLFLGPGNRNVIGGLGAVVKSAGRTREEMTLRADASLKAAIGSGPSFGNFPPRGVMATFYARRPTTRMGVAWEFRKAFADARNGDLASGSAEGREILKRALEGGLKVRIAASRATDLETALKAAEELGLSVVFEEAHEAYKLAPILAARRVPVLLRPAPAGGAPQALEGAEARPGAFAALREAGVTTALLAADESDPDSLLAGAAFAVRFGARREDALRAVTIVPAEILGVAGRVGSLEAGKDADLVILSGDPLDLTSRVEMVLIGGKVVYGGRTGK